MYLQRLDWENIRLIYLSSHKYYVGIEILYMAGKKVASLNMESFGVNLKGNPCFVKVIARCRFVVLKLKAILLSVSTDSF